MGGMWWAGCGGGRDVWEALPARLFERRVADVADRVDAVDVRHHFVVDGDAAVVLVVDLLLDEVGDRFRPARGREERGEKECGEAWRERGVRDASQAHPAT